MGLSSATAKWRTSSLAMGVGAASSTRQHLSTVDEKKSSRPKRPQDEASSSFSGHLDEARVSPAYVRDAWVRSSSA